MATRMTATITPTMNCRSALEKMSPATTSDAIPIRMVTIQPIGSEPGWKSRPSAPTRAPTMISNIQCIKPPFQPSRDKRLKGGGGFGHLVPAAHRDEDLGVEPPISHSDVSTIMGLIGDIRVDVAVIRRLLEEDNG